MEEVAEAIGTLKMSSLNCATKSVGEAMDPKVKDTFGLFKQSAPILGDCSNVANLLLLFK